MPRTFGQLFPWPFVGVAVLLVLLILVTPNLLTAGGGPAAGSIETQAELVVDRTATNSTLHFYVRGLGMVRYSTITFATVGGFGWPPTFAVPGANWTNRSWSNDSLVFSTTYRGDPVAVNVSAVYVDPSGQTVRYDGLYAFHVVDASLYTTDLSVGAAPVSPTALSNLPLAFPLTGTSLGGGSS